MEGGARAAASRRRAQVARDFVEVGGERHRVGAEQRPSNAFFQMNPGQEYRQTGKVPVKLTSVNFETLTGFSRPGLPPLLPGGAPAEEAAAHPPLGGAART